MVPTLKNTIPVQCNVSALDAVDDKSAVNNIVSFVFMIMIIVTCALAAVAAVLMVAIVVPLCIVCSPLLICLGMRVLERQPHCCDTLKHATFHTCYNHEVIGICVLKKNDPHYVTKLKIAALFVSVLSIIAASCISQQINLAVSQQIYQRYKGDTEECIGYRICYQYCKEDNSACSTIGSTFEVAPSNCTTTTTQQSATRSIFYLWQTTN